MLDVHAVPTTPGAALVLGSAGTAPAVNDGAQVAGVPLMPGANLRIWGFNAPTADTIANLQLQSQDQADPVNGITVTPGAASLLVQFYDYTTLQYVKGTRQIKAGTNTGVVAGHAFTIDEYNLGKCQMIRHAMGGEVMIGAITFGGGLTTNQWSSVSVAPTNPLPAGQYVLLGAYVSAIANTAVIRFSHADFKGLKPGFPVANWELALATTAQVAMRDELVQVSHGEQFIALGDIFGTPQCPQFTVGNAGTGLNIEMISVQTDTPVVNIVVMRVGN